MFRFSPIHELLCSVRAWVDPTFRTTSDLGAEWHRKLRGALPPDVLADLKHRDVKRWLSDGMLLPAVLAMPDGASVAEGLDWLEARTSSDWADLYARTPHAAPRLEGSDGAAAVSRLVALLRRWDTAYFRHLDPCVLHHLSEDAAARMAALPTQGPDEAVFEATRGVHMDFERLTQLVLIPQHHLSPWNVNFEWGPLQVTYYPSPWTPPNADEGAPSPELLRLFRALADESRLRILRCIADSPRTFTEIVAAVNLSKGTVHHHLVALRAAGLVTLRPNESGLHMVYRCRGAVPKRLAETLSAYLEGASPE